MLDCVVGKYLTMFWRSVRVKYTPLGLLDLEGEGIVISECGW
jgi:hypothetical protein